MGNKRIVGHRSESSKTSFVAHGDFIYRHETTLIFIQAKDSSLEDTGGYRYLHKRPIRQLAERATIRFWRDPSLAGSATFLS